jgi:CRISPR-associated endonuclease/helicase Cas3
MQDHQTFESSVPTGTGMLDCLWAKTAEDSTNYHPLKLHLLDVGACAEGILNREPETTRSRMAAILGLPWEDAHPWLLLLIACHDLGKACPGFQCKWDEATTLLAKAGFSLPRNPNTNINHCRVSDSVGQSQALI